MSLSPSRTTCLAILLKPDTPILNTTLLSAKPFIDFWVICSERLQPKEQQDIRNTLAGVDGVFVEHEMSHYGNAKTHLVRRAQQHADWVLVLQMNEEICTLTSKLTLPKKDKVGLVTVSRNASATSRAHTSREARLFASDCDVVFEYPVADHANFGNLKCCLLDSLSIQNHEEKPDWSDDRITNRFLLDAVLGKYEPSAELSLLLGKVELSKNQLELALTHFEHAVTLVPRDCVLWMAHFLAGNIQIKKRNLASALNHWQAAFELDPNRAEPLFRLAELHFFAGDLNTAGLLGEQASAMKVPRFADYYEPALYTHHSAILTAQCWHRLGLNQDAIDLLRTALHTQTNKNIKSELQSSLNEIMISLDNGVTS